jgi:hypothetical protein
MGLVDGKVVRPGFGDLVSARGMKTGELNPIINIMAGKLKCTLILGPIALTFIALRSEFSMARDQNVGLHTTGSMTAALPLLRASLG